MSLIKKTENSAIQYAVFLFNDLLVCGSSGIISSGYYVDGHYEIDQDFQIEDVPDYLQEEEEKNCFQASPNQQGRRGGRKKMMMMMMMMMTMIMMMMMMMMMMVMMMMMTTTMMMMRIIRRRRKTSQLVLEDWLISFLCFPSTFSFRPFSPSSLSFSLCFFLSVSDDHWSWAAVQTSSRNPARKTGIGRSDSQVHYRGSFRSHSLIHSVTYIIWSVHAPYASSIHRLFAHLVSSSVSPSLISAPLLCLLFFLTAAIGCEESRIDR